ncbi:MAG: hypothetical protein RLY43_1667 [Bacteroidota bacterium]|jgi:hypothetical protein
MKKKIFVFGNADLEIDNLPLRILPKLEEKFPEIDFVLKDPNEEWEVSEEITILDTAIGIKEVVVFDSLEKFGKVPTVGMHDFDALTNLRFLTKLGKIKKIKIIAIPANMEEEEAVKKVSATLR